MHNSFTFLGQPLKLFKAQYENGNTALVANTSDGLPFMTISVNLKPLDKNLVAVKDYSENEGILQTLIDAGAIETTGQIIYSGFVACPVVRVSPKIPEAAK